MRSRRSFYILLGVTLVAVMAAVLSQRGTDPARPDHGLHAPHLAEKTDAVRVVAIRTTTDTMRLVRTEDGWLVTNKANYPADAGRIRQLVLGMSRLRRLERKTSDPARHTRLELSDVDQPGSQATRIELLDAGGRSLAALLVGKTEDFQAAGRSRYFVRDAGDDQTWLVEGVLPPVLGEMRNWLQQDLLAGVDDGTLRTLTVTRAGASALTVGRDTVDADLELVDLADGERLDSQHAVDAIADTFRGMSLKDFADNESARRAEPVATVEAVTFSGVRISADIRQGDPDYLVRLDAAHDPGLAADEDARQAGEALVERLSQRWEDRWFVVSQYALDGLLVERADLLEASGSSDNG